MPKDYLGDHVYAETEDGRIKLTGPNLSSRKGEMCVIYLEPEVYHRLVTFVESIQVEPMPHRYRIK